VISRLGPQEQEGKERDEGSIEHDFVGEVILTWARKVRSSGAWNPGRREGIGQGIQGSLHESLRAS
jgi:hypothetical protein